MTSCTGVGAVPGTDVHAAVRMVVDFAADSGPGLLHLPELPDRGAAAGATGRAVGLLAELAADLQPAGWRLTGGGAAGGGSLDQRRARSLLAEDLDAFEEHSQGWAATVKVQVAGPWTLAATVERPRGDRVLADHGARRELVQSLAEGVAAHIADVRRRVPEADVVVQVDEPELPAVLAGGVATASGFGRHRTVAAPEASSGLAEVLAAVTAAGARPVVRCSAPAVPVDLVRGAGATAVSLDVSLLTRPELDTLAAAVADGLDLWPGLDLLGDPGAGVDDVMRLFGALGVDPGLMAPRTVVTPAGGLAGVSPERARRAYARAGEVARRLSDAEEKMSM